eukprot:10189081-Lingulodinium_polyedra.AAC.1
MSGMVALVLYALASGEQMPDCLKDCLSAAPVKYVRHASGIERFVANMVISSVNHRVIRYDPLLLAAELSRQGMSEKDIRQV